MDLFKIILLMVYTLCGVFLISCQKNTKPSILVIAVDSLSSFDLTCSDELSVELMDKKSGFSILCKESIRFTHAFTTSNLSGPAMASVLTGQYPFQHGLRHYNSVLSNKKVTLAEVALKNDYRTSFYSGGPPILRSSGLQQGFEIFDDQFISQKDALFRPFSGLYPLFVHWLRNDVNSMPFFSTMYVPDLSFTNRQHYDEAGLGMSLDFDSQLEIFDSGLYDLFTQLKKMNLWDNMYVVVVGLNGRPNENRLNETISTNLNNENTQVLLLFKPAQKKRDEGINWKVDKNVTLVDLGKTFFNLFKSEIPSHDTFPSISLKSLITHSEFVTSSSRPILIETAWGVPIQAANIRYGIIYDQFLYLHDKDPRVFNTLTDYMGLTSMNPGSAPSFPYKVIQDNLNKENMKEWTAISDIWRKKISIPYSTWTVVTKQDELAIKLNQIVDDGTQDEVLLEWAALMSLRAQQWRSLKKLAMRSSNKLWKYVANKNLIHASKIKNASGDLCFDLLFVNQIETTDFKKCTERLFVDLVKHIRSKDLGLNKEIQKNVFEKKYKQYRFEEEIQKTNIGMGMVWSLNSKLKLKPNNTDLALSLPEFKKFQPTK